MSQSFFEYVSTSNSDYKLTKAQINQHETNTSNSGKAWSFWGGTHYKPARATRGAKSKKLDRVELKLAPYKDS